MAESLVLFESVINSRWFLRTSVIVSLVLLFLSWTLDQQKCSKKTRFEAFIPPPFETTKTGCWLHTQFTSYACCAQQLFLNKIDLFKVKLPKVPLDKYFPEYTGGSDVNKAAKYILWRFTQLNRARLSIYPHLTQATDTGNIRLVFAAVKETILQNALRDSGIL